MDPKLQFLAFWCNSDDNRASVCNANTMEYDNSNNDNLPAGGTELLKIV